MTSTFNRRRAGRTGGIPTIRPRLLGTVRQSQLVTTYGVGALVAVDNESFIVSGIDSWEFTEGPVEIFERRLSRMLGVRSFRLPPAPDLDSTDGLDGVRLRRFPDFYSCSECSALGPFAMFNSPRGKAVCSRCDAELVPSRFVLTCELGHIVDFPYWKWVHRGKDVKGLCGGELSLETEGSSASLRSIVVSCSCGVEAVSMEGAFRKKALKDLGIRCSGRRPWLPGAAPEPCDHQPRAMQRGSSSVWHPMVASALSIPPWGHGVMAVIERERLLTEDESFIRRHLERDPTLLTGIGATIDDVIQAVRELRLAEEGTAAHASGMGRLREEEYERLRREHPEEHSSDWQPFVCTSPPGDASALDDSGLLTPMLVTRLREVRALSAFVRGDMPTEGDPVERRAALSLADGIDWLPAMEVSGEGVFLRLDPDRLKNWEQTVSSRVDEIRDSHLTLLRQRAKNDANAVAGLTSPVTPRYVLLHTLAHVLITEWSLDGGYPASALRERLYSSDTMAGLLIYTATSDSAGSLGGVVAQGDPARLAHSLRAALERAMWCSNDPLCMEADSSGADSLNKAACHACLLLPETSCETFNAFLDRALLVGCPEKDVTGFFEL
jgi:hypothetical protein